MHIESYTVVKVAKLQVGLLWFFQSWKLYTTAVVSPSGLLAQIVSWGSLVLAWNCGQSLQEKKKKKKKLKIHSSFPPSSSTCPNLKFISKGFGMNLILSTVELVVTQPKAQQSPCWLTVSFLVAPKYVVKIIRTCKGAGAVNNWHLGRNGEKDKESIP